MAPRPKTKEKRKVITIQQKQEIIKKYEQGLKKSALCIEYGLPSSTVATICAQKERLKSVKVIDKSTRMFKNRSDIVEVEKRLLIWIKEKQTIKDHISIEGIRKKALEFYEHVKKNFPRNSESEIRPFKASQGWFYKFKKRAEIANLTGLSKKQLYLHKKKRPPTSSSTILIPDNAHIPPPAVKIPKKQTFTKGFQEQNLKKKKHCQENVCTDRQTIGHISKMPGKPKTIPVQNPICIFEESENVPHPVQFSTPPVPIPVVQPKSIEIPQPQGKKIFILADHQKNVMSNLALLWKNGKLCDAGIGNGLSTVMVHKVVLSAVCPKLLSVFGTDMLSQRFLQINLPEEVSTDALNAFADYMYNGILDLDENILHQLKIIAKQLDMKEFEQLCDSQLPSTTHQQPTSTSNVFVGSSQMQANVSMSPNITTTPVQPSSSFRSISSKSLSTLTTQVIDIKDEISKIKLSLPKDNRANVFGQKSKVVLLDTSVDSNSSGGFVMVPSVKNETVGPVDDGYHEHNNEFYTSTPVSISSWTPSTSLNSTVVSSTEYVLPFSDTTDSKATTNVIHGISSKLKSNVFESSLVSDLSPVSCSLSSPIRKDSSKPLNRTITTQSIGKIVTSGSSESVYPVRLFTAGGDSLPLSSTRVTNVKNVGLYKTHDLT